MECYNYTKIIVIVALFIGSCNLLFPSVAWRLFKNIRRMLHTENEEFDANKIRFTGVIALIVGITAIGLC